MIAHVDWLTVRVIVAAFVVAVLTVTIVGGFVSILRRARHALFDADRDINGGHHRRDWDI